MAKSQQRVDGWQGRTGATLLRIAATCLVAVMLSSGTAPGKPSARKTPTKHGASARMSFKTEVLPILKDSCAAESGCHVGQAAAAGLRLDEPDPYATLVNARSSLQPARMRVKPGKPHDSVLWLKLTGKHKQAGVFGDRMPPGKPLPASEMRVIERWIRQGALR